MPLRSLEAPWRALQWGACDFPAENTTGSDTERVDGLVLALVRGSLSGGGSSRASSRLVIVGRARGCPDLHVLDGPAACRGGLAAFTGRDASLPGRLRGP